MCTDDILGCQMMKESLFPTLLSVDWLQNYKLMSTNMGGMETKDVKDMLPYINLCNSLIEQRSAETTAKLMHVQVNGVPEMGVRGRHVNYNAQYNTGVSRACGRGRRDMRREICRACGQTGH